MLYRIITENKNKTDICRIVSLSFNDFTVYETIGYYNGKQESSLVIEIDIFDTIRLPFGFKLNC